jgi:hypothetical protein
MVPSVVVLTGDLVGSSSAGSEMIDRSMAALQVAVQQMGSWQIGVDPRFTRFRGDGWQVMVLNPAFGLRAAVFLLASLRAAHNGLASRVSLGHGSLSHRGTESLADASGTAFLASGRGLDLMRKQQRIAICGDGVTPLHRGYGALLTALVRRWSTEQAEAMVLALDPAAPTLARIADHLKISPQAVNYRLASASGTEVKAALRDWESQFQRDTGAEPSLRRSARTPGAA